LSGVTSLKVTQNYEEEDKCESSNRSLQHAHMKSEESFQNPKMNKEKKNDNMKKRFSKRRKREGEEQNLRDQCEDMHN